ncbi:MAG: hypothetical protein RIT26_1425, partial [Pseudomonadota bacterium]
WRDALLATDEALSDWMMAFPDSDSQQMRALMRQARKDNPANAKTESQGLAPRQGRAYRELFQIIKQHLAAHEQP